MKKFLVLYRSETSEADMMATAAPEQAKAGMDAWMTGAGAHAFAFHTLRTDWNGDHRVKGEC